MDSVIDEAGPRRMIGRASIVAAGTAYQQGISFISGLIVARVIGASDFGIFNLARNLLDLTAIVTRMGLDIGLQRLFGESNTAQDRTSHVVVLRRVRLLASSFALLTVAAVVLGLGRVSRQGFITIPTLRRSSCAWRWHFHFCPTLRYWGGRTGAFSNCIRPLLRSPSCCRPPASR